MIERQFALGLDYGTDSVRAIIIDANTGEVVGSKSVDYKIWDKGNGKFIDKEKEQYRQHPLDYTEGLEDAVKLALDDAMGNTGDANIGQKVISIGVDTTGSTVVPVTKEGIPLALLPDYSEDPNAMFKLWEDHTGKDESDLINKVSQETENGRFTQYVGGVFSPEWFWAKILRTIRTADPKLVKDAYSHVEHADWIPALLTGNNDDSWRISNPATWKLGRCGMGHKALWHKDFGGFPFEFLTKVDSKLGELEGRINNDTYTSDTTAGKLTKKWADKLGLKEGIAVAVGAYDAHMGAVGNGIKPGILSRIVGTSTCDMVVAPYDVMRFDGREKLIAGICGQVDGSIIPGMFGLEAGQSAVGNIFNHAYTKWFDTALGMGEVKEDQREELRKAYFKYIEDMGAKIGYKDIAKLPLVIPHHGGRRTPYANHRLSGAVLGEQLGTTNFAEYAALVFGTNYTGRHIMETFTSQGVKIDEVIACGGVADKSAFLMQSMADTFGVPIRVSASGETCAIGAAIFGAVAAGKYRNIQEAQEKLCPGFKVTYTPKDGFKEVHEQRYQMYREQEKQLEKPLMAFK